MTWRVNAIEESGWLVSIIVKWKFECLVWLWPYLLAVGSSSWFTLFSNLTVITFLGVSTTETSMFASWDANLLELENVGPTLYAFFCPVSWVFNVPIVHSFHFLFFNNVSFYDIFWMGFLYASLPIPDFFFPLPINGLMKRHIATRTTLSFKRRNLCKNTKGVVLVGSSQEYWKRICKAF